MSLALSGHVLLGEWLVEPRGLRITGAGLGDRVADYAGLCAGLEALEPSA